MTKIGTSLKNFKDRLRASVNLKAHNGLFFTALLLVIILALLLRLTPLLRGPTLIKAFDPWIQYYNASYLSEHNLFEYFHWWDLKSWFPEGTARYSLRPGLTFLVVIIYNVLNFIGIPITIYDVCFYFPAFMGGLTVLAAYFLGKEILNKQMGLFAAFFLAFNTGHMQRTMAGFFDNETIGVFGALMSILFFLKAIRTGKITHAVTGGMFLGFLSLSWGGYEYIYLLLPLVIGIMVLSNKYNEHMLIAYAGVQGTGLLIFGLFSGFSFGSLFSSLEIGGVFFFSLILLIFHIIYTKKAEYPKLYNNIIKGIVWLLVPGALIAALIIWVAPDIIPFGFGARLQSVLSPLIRDQMHIVASVAEHMPSAWSVFYYNTLIPLMLIPLGIFFCFKRLNYADVTLMLFILTLFYFTGSMIRIILLFAPAAALMGSYGLVSVLKLYGSFTGQKRQGISRKRRRQVEKTVGSSEVAGIYIIVGFLCIAQVIHATDISVNQLSYNQMAAAAGQFHDWEESLTWMRNNLDGTDVVVSWWDYGYWLTPIGNVTTVNDNATWNTTRIGLTGMAFMQTNEIYSAKILRLLHADYILVYYGGLISGLGGDEGKWPWMVRICNDHYNVYKNTYGLEEDNWEENTVFDENKYHNQTSGLREDAWFESQIARLMFHGEPTNLNYAGNSYIQYYFAGSMSGGAQGINQLKDDDGDTWKSHLEPYLDSNGFVNYSFKVFKPKYFSNAHMVKLYTVDYTALESSFEIIEPYVFDNTQKDYAVFKIKNTGQRDLTIKNVYINNQPYDNFIMGDAGATKILSKGSTDLIWVDIKAKGKNFETNDIVNISVSAQADALEGTKYIFSNSTSYFFVEPAKDEALKINRVNSEVIQVADELAATINLEVENIGQSILKIDSLFSLKPDNSVANIYNESKLNFGGSPILEPGEKVDIVLNQSAEAYFPYGDFFNRIGVSTINNATDITLFSGNQISYKLSILEEERVKSPEIEALDTYSNNYYNPYRNHIPFKMNGSNAIRYDNGTTIITLDVKNTGKNVLGLQSVLFSEGQYEPFLSSDKYVWDTTDSDLILNPGEQKTIRIIAEEDDLFEVNGEFVITVVAMGVEGVAAASDVGYLHTIRNAPDFQILKLIDGVPGSLILANESGYLTIKNTGNESITINKITVNQTDVFNIKYLYGNETLGVQDCAIIYFDINDTLLTINKTNSIDVNVTTVSGLSKNITLQAVVDVFSHAIGISASESSAQDTGNLVIKVINGGSKNVTVVTVQVNGSYVPLVNFTLGVGETFEIAHNLGSITMTIDMDVLEALIPVSFSAGNKLEVLIRTKEGAEATRILTVT